MIAAVVVHLFSNHSVANTLSYISIACGAYFALGKAYESLSELSIDVDFLMVFAAVGAIVVGQPEDAAVLLFLFSLSSTLEHLAMAKTKSAIEGLVKLRPSEAIRVQPEGDEKVAVEQLTIGDLVRVAPFETIPVDGSIEKGESSVDQSAMTGESVAVSKGPGETVLGGTQNLDGALVIRVASTVGDSTLDKIVSLVEEAQENKSGGERISQWFGQRYTFFVLGAFIVSLVIRLIVGSAFSDALYGALVLLVALSPCALVISTPASTLSALAWAAKHGMLVRGGQFIELAGSVDTIALDKTGTLTTGKPVLVEICVCKNEAATVSVGSDPVEHSKCWHGTSGLSDLASEVLSAAASLEQYASHPIAEAVVGAAKKHGVSIPEALNLKVVPGHGVTGLVNDERVYIGKLAYLEEEGLSISKEFREHIDELASTGMPLAAVAKGDTLAALGFSDAIRSNVSEILGEFRSLGINKVVMLTGDTPATARRIGESVGITEVRAGLLPADKASTIKELTDSGCKTLMVGDGINDAPALTTSTVGVAMGGLGSDIALNAADVVLMNDKLERIPELIRLGRKTSGVIRVNLLFATGMITALTIASFLTRLPLPVAVVGHEGSTVLVILNGLRLLKGPK